MEQKAGSSSQNVAYESPLGSFKDQVATIIGEERPSKETTLELLEFSPRQTLPEIILVPGATQKDTNPSVSVIKKDDNSNNLPVLIKDCIHLPKEPSKVKTSINRIVKKLCKLGIPEEVGVLGNIGKILSRYSKELDEALKTYQAAEKDKSNPGRSLLCYSCEKRIRDILNTSSTATLGATILLAKVTGIKNKDIDQSVELDINIDGSTIQELRKKVTVGTINFLLQNVAHVKSAEKVLSDDLQLKNSAIQLEYCHRAQRLQDTIKKTFTKQPPVFDQQITDFMLHQLYYNNVLSDEGFKFHQFDIEKLDQYPTYQIRQQFLSIIDTWVREHLLDQEQEVWKIIVYENSKLRIFSEIVNVLFQDIKPELHKDWMKKLVEDLASMTDKNNYWNLSWFLTNGRYDSEIQFKGNYFIETMSNQHITLIPLIEGTIKKGSKIHYPKDKDGKLLLEQYDKKIALLDDNGDISRLYSQVDKQDKNGNRKAHLSDGKLDYLNANHQIIFQECTSISDVENDGKTRIEKDGDWILFNPTNNQIEFQNCSSIGDVEVDGNRRFIRNGSIFLRQFDGRISEECQKIFGITKNTIGWGRLSQRENGEWFSLFSDIQDITEEFPLARGDQEGIYTVGGERIELDSEKQTILDKHKVIFDKNTGNLIVKREDGNLYLIHAEFHIVPNQNVVTSFYGSSLNKVAQSNDYNTCIIISPEDQIVSDEYQLVKEEGGDLQLDKSIIKEHKNLEILLSSFQKESLIDRAEKVYWDGGNKIIMQIGINWVWSYLNNELANETQHVE